MRKAAQLVLFFGSAWLLTSLWLPGFARAALTTNFSEGECSFSSSNRTACPTGDDETFINATCYKCSIGDGKPGSCLAYCDSEDGGTCHCEVEETCPEGAVISGGGCELHSGSVNLIETAPSANGWECSWSKNERFSPGPDVDTYAVCVGSTP